METALSSVLSTNEAAAKLPTAAQRFLVFGGANTKLVDEGAIFSVVIKSPVYSARAHNLAKLFKKKY
jgi:hypothetical protein